MFKNSKISILWNHIVKKFVSNQDSLSLNSIEVSNVLTQKESTLKIDGAFVAIGHIPETAVFKGHIAMDNSGYIKVSPGTPFTNIKGIFAAGDVHDNIYRQAITAAGFGCMAALESEKFLSSL